MVCWTGGEVKASEAAAIDQKVRLSRYKSSTYIFHSLKPRWHYWEWWSVRESHGLQLIPHLLSASKSKLYVQTHSLMEPGVSLLTLYQMSVNNQTHIWALDSRLTYSWSTSTTSLLQCFWLVSKEVQRPPVSGKGEQEGSVVGGWPRIACNLGIFLDRQSIVRRIEGGVRQC